MAQVGIVAIFYPLTGQRPCFLDITFLKMQNQLKLNYWILKSELQAPSCSLCSFKTTSVR